jgi:hypothetical protein
MIFSLFLGSCTRVVRDYIALPSAYIALSLISSRYSSLFNRVKEFSSLQEKLSQFVVDTTNSEINMKPVKQAVIAMKRPICVLGYMSP